MNLKIPEISIIITNFNYGRYLERCIRSCINQVNVEHEVILVDDCSTDNSRNIIKKYSTEIKTILLDSNVGVSNASNIGIQNSRGRFFVRVDADDYINPYMCYFLDVYLKNNRDVFGVACDYEYVDEHENKIERIYAEDKPISCGVMYRKELFENVGGYNDSFRYKEHEEFLKRLDDSFYKIEYLRIPFYRYRRHGNNKTLSSEYSKVSV